MWDIVSLHVSFMFYICRTRGSRKRCKNSLIVITFSLLVLAGFYGVYTGKGSHRGNDTPVRRIHGARQEDHQVGLGGLPVVDRDNNINNLYQNIPNEPYVNVQRVDKVDIRQEVKNVFEKEKPAKNNDFYPGFDKPWKQFADPIILQPQPVAAQPVENRFDHKPPAQQVPNQVPVAGGDPPKANIQAIHVERGVNVEGEVNAADKKSSAGSIDHRIHLAVVCCGDRSEETLVMLKTAVLNTQQKLVFHIFAEEELKAGLAQMLKSWPADFQTKMEFVLHSIQFPKGENPEEWKKVFKTCATQRLFLPDILTDVDSILYVDTDILFIRPLDSIWSFFKEFNATHLAALAPEHEIKNIGWYNRFARHPYYGMTGLNSGVMLMNLTRMRAFGWTQKIVPIYREYKLKITWGDQDLINILFNFYPDRVFVYPCEWNFRPDHCMYSNNCHRINEHGVAVIHGNRGVYHNEKQWPFRMIYEAFLNFKLGTTADMHLVQPLQRKLSEPKSLNLYCGKTLIQPVVATLRKVCQENKSL